MKVSRKVGRRSRSSISRRRFKIKKNKKSSYKKRYGKTHKGGACSRKYGNKRGKRFHRGGKDNKFNCDAFNKTFTTQNSERLQGQGITGDFIVTANNNDKYMEHQFDLTFKKKDTFSITDGTEKFALKVYISNNWVQIVLERVTGSSRPPSFTFEGVFPIILKDFENPITWDNIEEDSGLRKYNFNFESNIETFAEIADCLRTLNKNL
jgi:hypothetical protein